MYTLDTYTIHEKDDMPITFEIVDSFDEPSKPTEKQASKRSSSYILYELRHTFRPEDDTLDKQKDRVKDILTVLNPYTDGYWMYAIEHFKRGMVPCKPHVHIRFLSYDTKETIRKTVVYRHFTTWKGNRDYALSVVPDQNIKAFRYVFKQQKNETHRLCKYTKLMEEYIRANFTISDMATLRNEAYAVWLTACEVQDKKEAKEELAHSLQDRLFKYLDNSTVLTDLSIKIHIQKFYIEEEKKPFNKTTALGYFYNYKIIKNLMSHEELALIW